MCEVVIILKYVGFVVICEYVSFYRCFGLDNFEIGFVRLDFV